MKGNVQFILIVNLILFIGLCSGCTSNVDRLNGDKNQNITQLHTSNPIDQSIANRAEESVIKNGEVTNVRAISTNKELFLAIKVKQMNRFHLKTIEKKIKSQLEQKFPDHKVLVSTDQKIYLEIEKLENELKKDKMKKKEFTKKLRRIEKLSKEKP